MSSPADAPHADDLLPAVAALFAQALALPAAQIVARRETPLLGAVPELDSMAVVGLLTAIEDRFGLTLDESDISAATFATLGSLSDFVAAHLRR